MYGDSASGGIDDQRCPFVLGQFDAPLVPELVVRQYAAFGSRLVARARGTLLRIEQVSIQTGALGRFKGSRLFCSQGLLPFESFRPVERGERAKREDALDVGVTVRCQTDGLVGCAALGDSVVWEQCNHDKGPTTLGALCDSSWNLHG